MPFKLRRASWTGGTLAHKKLNHPSLLPKSKTVQDHPSLLSNSETVGSGFENISINTIVRVDGLLGQDKVQFVLDSGAALSVVRYDVVNPAYHRSIKKEGASAAVGANGQSLDVIGRVTLPIKLGERSWDQEFTVVKNLTISCLLGADFLIQHGAIVDCRIGQLSLG